MPAPLLAAAGISAAGSLLSGILGNSAAKRRDKRQAKYDMKLAEYGYNKDHEMWSEANEYNKPIEQMNRLKEAGLNPHLVYGSGSATGNTSQASTPKYQNPGTQFKVRPQIDPQSMLNQFINLKTAQQNIATMKSSENLQNAKASTEVFNSALKNNAAKKSGIEVDNMPQLYKYNFGIKQGILDQQQMQFAKTLQETKGVKAKNYYQNKINERADQGIFTGDNNIKTFIQMMNKFRFSPGSWFSPLNTLKK